MNEARLRASSEAAADPVGAAPARLRYEPALDGIRALAVLAVMVFHAGVTSLRGGFLGVDLFFVLSGFLITTLLLREQDDDGGVRLGAFYGRRARRLLPALLLLLLAVVGYAQFLGPAFTRGSVRLDAVASLFYVANWRFILSHQSYFAELVEPSPLRHVWSLAVEEQWYLIWPCTLLLLRRVTRGRDRRLALLIALAGVASWVWMVVLVRGDADVSRAYYGLFSHAFVLLGGATLAAGLHACRDRNSAQAGLRSSIRSRLVEVVGWIGLVTVVASFFVVAGDDRWLYRGWYVVFTLAGVALVHAVMVPGPSALRRVLRTGPLPWIGRLSYGLYLWHWPVGIWLNPSRIAWSTWPLLALRLLVSFAVATASYYLVERPVRTAAWQRLRHPERATLHVMAVSSLVVLLVILLGIRVPSGQPVLPWGGDLGGVAAPRPQRPTPVEPGKLRVLVIGDSVAFTQVYGAVPSGASLIPGAHIGCGLVPYTRKLTDDLIAWDGAPGECAGTSEDWAYAVTQQPDVIVLVAGAWEVYDRKIGDRTYRVGTPAYDRLITTHLEDVRAFFRARTDVPLVIEDVPCMRPPDLGLGAAKGARADDARVAWVNGVFRRFAAAHPHDVSMLAVSQYACPGGHPRDTVDGVTLRPDGAHYDPKATTALWNWMVPRLLRTPGVVEHYPAGAVDPGVLGPTVAPPTSTSSGPTTPVSPTTTVPSTAAPAATDRSLPPSGRAR